MNHPLLTVQAALRSLIVQRTDYDQERGTDNALIDEAEAIVARLGLLRSALQGSMTAETKMRQAGRNCLRVMFGTTALDRRRAAYWANVEVACAKRVPGHWINPSTPSSAWLHRGSTLSL